MPIDQDEVRAAVRAPGRGRGRGDRHLLPVQLSASEHEQPRLGDPAEICPEAFVSRLARGAARVPRVRAAVHHRRQRRPRAGAWSATWRSCAPALQRARASQRPPVHHAVQRRHDVGRRGRRALRSARCCPGPSGGVVGRRVRRRSRPGSTTSSPSTWAAPAPTSPRSATARRASTTGVEIDGLPLRTPDARHPHRRRRRRRRSPGSTPAARSRSGPQSAGADPGPACYGRGGTEPTVTDANVVLGRLNPTRLLGGRMPIDAATAAPRDRGGSRAGWAWPLRDAAQGIISVVNANMARAIRVISVERGYDPRDFTLVPFGGAGPLHARDSPRARHAARPGAGRARVLSALGLLVDRHARRLRAHRSSTAATRAPAGARPARFAELSARADGVAGRARASPARSAGSDRWIDMRYAGQNYELPVEVPGRELGADVAARAARTGGSTPRTSSVTATHAARSRSQSSTSA